jgi:membrane-bound serine protease (ClpP class)
MMDARTLIVIMMLAALVLFALEVYVPGFVLGSIGLVLMISAVVVGYREYGGTGAMIVFVTGSVLGLVVVFSSLKYFPDTSTGKKMILGANQANMRACAAPTAEWVGREGVAQSMLRPSGVAVVDGKRLDVVSESGMIEMGSPIRIVAVTENRVIVRKI